MTTGTLTNITANGTSPRRRGVIEEWLLFIFLFTIAIAWNFTQGRLAFYAGQGRLDPRVLWCGGAMAPLPAILYLLGIWALHSVSSRPELKLATRVTAFTILLAI